MNPCKITEDLLPLYVDGTLSEDSREFVGQHLAGCEACRRLYGQMNKTVAVIPTRQSTKKTFARFNRRLFWKRFALAVLCVLLVLGVLTAILFVPVGRYLAKNIDGRIGPVDAGVSRLSEGSIFVEVRYADSDPYIGAFERRVSPSEPDVVYLTPVYDKGLQLSRLWNRIFSGYSLENNTFQHIFTTEESHGNYAGQLTDLSQEDLLRRYAVAHGPFRKIVLKGTDGERVLWEEGDELPPAGESGEYTLRWHVDQLSGVHEARYLEIENRTPSPDATPVP